MIPAYPKIYALGSKPVTDIFDGVVEVTEKVDGSFFGFGKLNGEVLCRSKGQQLNMESPEKMFTQGVEYVKSIADKLDDSVMYYGEYMNKPRHNTLKYETIPLNHIALFNVVKCGQWVTSREEMVEEAAKIDMGIVPLISTFEMHDGKFDTDILKAMLETESFLGGQKIEGVVVKNYEKQFLIGDRYHPIMAGKYVSEAFKEVHGMNKTFNSKGKWETYIEQYRTEARWEKGLQHLAESGVITWTPRDIGVLIKEVQADITEECSEDIKEFLFKTHMGALIRRSTQGLPEWYKDKLIDEPVA